jgi:hypothetical protein
MTDHAAAQALLDRILAEKAQARHVAARRPLLEKFAIADQLREAAESARALRARPVDTKD